jgi:hypothetical protein
MDRTGRRDSNRRVRRGSCPRRSPRCKSRLLFACGKTRLKAAIGRRNRLPHHSKSSICRAVGQALSPVVFGRIPRITNKKQNEYSLPSVAIRIILGSVLGDNQAPQATSFKTRIS